jgi:hypothetical protein
LGEEPVIGLTLLLSFSEVGDRVRSIRGCFTDHLATLIVSLEASALVRPSSAKATRRTICLSLILPLKTLG